MCGPSSGANFFGTLAYFKKIAPTLSKPVTAVFIVCDRLEWYLSYIKERRPDLFGLKTKKKGLHSLTEEQIEQAPAIGIRSAQLWIAKANPLIIDIRNPIAFEMGSIQQSINIPIEHLEALCNSTVPFCGNQRPTLLVCPIGQQSRRFVAFLKLQGADIYNLEGGLQAWRSVGYPLQEL